MKTLLVTSAVTFVPQNYDDLVCGLAACPQIGGLLVLENGGPGLFAKGLGAIAMGARRIGTQLIANLLGSSRARRETVYGALGKPVFRLPTINDPRAVELVRTHGFDLVLNARTRFIYKKAILGAPKLGCINIHHGLLPEQRGTMCDLWALHERRAAGFSIHVMTPKIDAGVILRRVEVDRGTERNFLAYVARSAQREREEAQALLAAIEAQGALTGTPNTAPEGLVHKRNPTWAEAKAMRRGGLLV